MKKLNTSVIVSVLLIICLAFTSCSVKSSFDAGMALPQAKEAPQVMNNMAADQAGEAEFGVQESVATTTIPQDDRKIIYEANLEMETLEFDASVKAIFEEAEKLGGYVSGTSLHSDKWQGAARSASYTFKIPANNYSQFIQGLASSGNVTYQNETTQDITSEYVDVEARLKSLKTQEERLIEMMENAGELETLLAIQNQLSEVQYKIESYTSQMRTFAAQVSYSTININLQEVKHITQDKDTFGQRIGAAFSESVVNLVAGTQNFIVAFVYNLPAIIILVILALGGLLIYKRSHNKIKLSKAEIKPEEPKNKSDKQ